MKDSTRRDDGPDLNRTLRDSADPEVGARTTLNAGTRENTGSDPVLQNLPRALANDYEIVEELSTKGAEADLFLVRRRRDGESFVAKIYRRGVTVKLDLLDKVSRVDREHVVQVVDFGESDDRFYELQEHMSLGSMADLIDQEGPRLQEGLVKDILHELLIAVHHLHEGGITHRDLKPANILVRSRKPLDLVLTDFGISSLMHDQSVRLTTGHRTIAYSAPEADASMVTNAADYWSLGLIVAEVLSGRHPYAGLSEQVISAAKATKPVQLDEVSEPWLKLCRGLLVRDPAHRWGRDFVARWLDGDETLPEPEVQWSSGAEGAVVVRPCRFCGREYTDAAALGEALAAHWDEGLKYLAKGWLRDWVYDDLRDQELTLFLDEMEEQAGLSDHVKLYRFIRRVAPDSPPSYREVLLDKENLANLARLAVQGDTRAATILQSIRQGEIVERTAEVSLSKPVIRLADSWRRSLEEYDRLSRRINESRSGQPCGYFQDESFRLALLLFSLLDEKFLGDLRSRTRKLVPGHATEAAWFAGLGNLQTAQAPALLLMQEWWEVAVADVERQRKEARFERERQAQLAENRSRRKRLETAGRNTLLVMAVTYGLAGSVAWTRFTLAFRRDYSEYNGYLGAFLLFMDFCLPAGATFISVFSGEKFLSQTIGDLKGQWGHTRKAFKFWLLAPIVVGLFAAVLPVVVFLVYGLIRLVFGAPNIDLSWEEQQVISAVIAYVAAWFHFVFAVRGMVDRTRAAITPT